MIRRFITISALAAGLASLPAMAAQRSGGSARPVAAGGNLVLAQSGDVDVYFDGNGNRILLDANTGEIIAVQPPRRAAGREAERRALRQRQLRGDPLNDQQDVAGFGDRNLGPVGPDDGAEDFSREPPEAYPEQFPPAPREIAPYDPDQPEIVSREPIERAPLGAEPPEPSIPSIIEQDGGAQPPLTFTAREDVAAIQILMDRAGASPGVIDGKFGSNVDKAFAAYRTLTKTNLKSTDSAGIKAALAASGGDPFVTYTITAEDAAGPFVASVPSDYSEKARLERLSYVSVPEMLGERFHMDEAYLKALNPDANFSRPGTIIRVANVGAPVSASVARITADKAQKQVLAYDAYDRLVAAYPATIGSSDTPSPTGTHAVSRIAFDPNYTYNPKVNFKQGENDKVLTIPPGPNGPVGSIWIALDKPTYGIHGTPDPSKIGKTESHGCVRLTNWDAAELAKIVSPGVTVEFLE